MDGLGGGDGVGAAGKLHAEAAGGLPLMKVLDA